MGYLYKGVCYSALSEARAATCSDVSGLFSFTSSTGNGNQQQTNVERTTCSTVDFVGSASMTLCKTLNGASSCTSTLSQPWPTYAPCSYDGGMDYAGAWLGFAMLLLVIAFGGKQLIDLFTSHHERD